VKTLRITIGQKTEESMKILGILNYPFTSKELSSCFRLKLKEVHPDTANGNGSEKKLNEQTRLAIESYKHLKNLAIDPEEGIKDIIEEEEIFDIFRIYETCPECGGKKVQTIVTGGDYCPDCSFSTSFFWFRTPRGYQYKKCDRCNGVGVYYKNGIEKGVCFKCNGLGITKIRCQRCMGTGYIEPNVTTRPCSKYHGKGKIEINPWNPVIPKGAVLGKKK